MLKEKKITLVIMAGGLGSRFGACKQLQGVGPHGELLLEYALHDARGAGFARAVVVIRRELEAEFRKRLGAWADRFQVDFVFQDGYIPPNTGTGGNREKHRKPWGTAHALLACRDSVAEPFAILNADDLYGREALTLVFHHLSRADGHCVLGFPLGDTLSDQGGVSRARLNVDGNGMLTSVEEFHAIGRSPDGSIRDERSGTLMHAADLISLNLWGFQSGIFPLMEAEFARFMTVRGQDETAELPLPTAVKSLCRQGIAIRVIAASASTSWCGVTYREDLHFVRQILQNRNADGTYPTPLLKVNHE